MRARGRNNEPVSRVAVKRRRQRIERKHHLNAELIPGPHFMPEASRTPRS